mmetsp:Transcript_30870/g.77311  ORF Transcript_30870/g.77311 Transcript_30870/m.77311 type:complete len:275 (+) Transcript_30870:3874-4698(+)
MDRQRLGLNNVSVEQPRNLRHGHRLLVKGHVHRLQSARPNPRKVLVQHARLQVTGALHQPEKGHNVISVIRAVRGERQLDVWRQEHVRAGASQIVEHLAAFHIVSSVTVNAEEKLVGEHLCLRPGISGQNPPLGVVVVHVPQGGERLGELLHVEMAVVAVQVRRRHRLFAQLVLGQHSEPDHLLQEMHGEAVSDGLQRQVLANRTQAVPQKFALGHERHLGARVEQTVELRRRLGQGAARANHVGGDVVDNPRVLLDAQRGVRRVAVQRIHSLE